MLVCLSGSSQSNVAHLTKEIISKHEENLTAVNFTGAFTVSVFLKANQTGRNKMCTPRKKSLAHP